MARYEAARRPRAREAAKLSRLVITWVALLTAIVAAGCSQEDVRERGAGTTESVSAAQETTQESPQTPTRGEATAGREVTSEARGSGSQGEPFTGDSEMSGGVGGTANDIRDVRFGRHESYERVVIDFGLGDEPASRVPVWSLSSPTGEGYTRIMFPGVTATAVTDGGFGGSIVDNFYVVRAPGEGLFVDIFATGAFQYRVTELSRPGRLAVDYRPASVSLSHPLPVRSDKTVLMQPRKGQAIAGELTVSGYSRNFEASNTVTLLDSSSGNVLSQSTVKSNDWTETWGYFEASMEIPPFEEQATLRVGSTSPRDGSFEGVEIPLAYRES